MITFLQLYEIEIILQNQRRANLVDVLPNDKSAKTSKTGARLYYPFLEAIQAIYDNLAIGLNNLIYYNMYYLGIQYFYWTWCYLELVTFYGRRT